MKVILLEEAEPMENPCPELLTNWAYLAPVLASLRENNADESRVLAMQQQILKTRDLSVASVFHPGHDRCTRSFYHPPHIFYEFDGEESYFWITSQLDRCYSLSVVYFPKWQLALSLYPYTIDETRLETFEQMRPTLNQDPAARPAFAAPSQVVVGHPHMMHTLWNELPALDRTIAAGLAAEFDVASTYQPLGPLDRLFPELQGRVTVQTMGRLQARNDEIGSFTMLGAWSIPATTQLRVIAVARSLTDRSTQRAQARFRRRHFPIIWLSVKPPDRGVADQAVTLAAIIEAIIARYPQAGLLIGGVSSPWDYAENPDYIGWFSAMLDAASSRTRSIIADLFTALPKQLHRAVRVVTDVAVTEEIGWAALSDFYFCHGGSMQNKIGWLHRIPGMMHSNRKFMQVARSMIPPLEAPAPVHYLPDELLLDDDPAGYSALQLARKDQNYRFTSIDAVIGHILEAIEASVPKTRLQRSWLRRLFK